MMSRLMNAMSSSGSSRPTNSLCTSYAGRTLGQTTAVTVNSPYLLTPRQSQSNPEYSLARTPLSSSHEGYNTAGFVERMVRCLVPVNSEQGQVPVGVGQLPPPLAVSTTSTPRTHARGIRSQSHGGSVSFSDPPEFLAENLSDVPYASGAGRSGGVSNPQINSGGVRLNSVLEGPLGRTPVQGGAVIQFDTILDSSPMVQFRRGGAQSRAQMRAAFAGSYLDGAEVSLSPPSALARDVPSAPSSRPAISIQAPTPTASHIVEGVRTSRRVNLPSDSAAYTRPMPNSLPETQRTPSKLHVEVNLILIRPSLATSAAAPHCLYLVTLRIFATVRDHLGELRVFSHKILMKTAKTAIQNR